MPKSFSTVKNKMSLTAQKAVEEKTSQLLKEPQLWVFNKKEEVMVLVNSACYPSAEIGFCLRLFN